MFWSSLYFDEDGDLAHEFYEETVVTKNGRKKAKLKRIHKNLIPQVSQHGSVLQTFAAWFLSLTKGFIILTFIITNNDNEHFIANFFIGNHQVGSPLYPRRFSGRHLWSLMLSLTSCEVSVPPQFSSRPLDPGHACCVAPPCVWEGLMRVCGILANEPWDAPAVWLRRGCGLTMMSWLFSFSRNHPHEDYYGLYGQDTKCGLYMSVCLFVCGHRNREYLAMFDFYQEHIVKDSGGPSRTFRLEFQRRLWKDQVGFECINWRAFCNKQSFADR